ncbi:sugar ABC transporter substrate-binding protein [Actinoplanes cyaneus]|jgi:simple sugar transport system substrate-binding protein|uniref:Sugar ABC transporter substrate-binding protein n=1 Tax=Actinoplanes cyaneus TaxID=52696 RepID=A0A919M081_9ACTN|nr:sugar ABC transporter substrate-binding protein [Actinoplanes cyaneus]MCW2137925.1 monosaccharide ABC transporter substrate-binding protein, CUT2 family [Actinoplanes cyaneus]GID64865.1 sugar ABC transporter substrate-binding protein [Actinoplanes cyaneus]
MRPFLAAAAVAVLSLAACSDGGRQETNSDTSGGGNAAGSSGYTVAFVTHETPGDTFWDKVRAGAEQAAKDEGVTLKYSNDPDAGKQAQLIQSAVDAKVNGIATTLVTPDALAGAVKSATTAGIPVVGLNAGIDQYQKLGALMYFGSDETVAGTSVGQRIAAAGAKHPLCVIHQTGSVSLEARCAGVKSAVPGTENLQVNGADDSAVTTTLQAKLAQDKSIDYVVTLGAPVALDAINAKQQASSPAKIVTFDLNQEMAKRIKDGSVEFAIDQQPYAQGYMAVSSLYLYLKNGNDLGGGKPVLTGPSFVDSANIDKILPFTEKNTR